MAQACLRSDKATRLREELSCMLVGDGAVGKTSMVISYIFNGYNSDYRQTAFDVFTGEWQDCLLKGALCIGSFIVEPLLLPIQVWSM